MRRRALSQVLALVAAVGACAGPAPAPTRPPVARQAPPPRPPPVATAAPTVQPAPLPEPAKPEAAVASPAIEDSSPPATPARWVASRDCPLTYDYRAVQRTETPSIGTATGFDTLGQIEAAVDSVAPLRVRFKFIWTRRDGVNARGSTKGVRTAENQGEVLLTTDGVRWVEAGLHPPSATLDVERLPRLLPVLPASAAAGSEATWKVPPQVVAAALAYDASRRLATVESAPIKITRWIRIGGELACELEGAWGKEKSGEEGQPGERVLKRTLVRGAARFVVLASGRLLTSEIHQTLDTFSARQGERLATSRGGDTERHENLSSELRLVKACNGVTMPPLHPPASPEERALMTFTQFREAVAHAQRPTIGLHLAPALVAQHGKEALVAALVNYDKRFGSASLGFVGPPRVTPLIDGERIAFSLTGSASDASAHSGRIGINVVVQHTGDDYWIRSIKATLTQASAVDVFEMSDQRLFVAEVDVLPGFPKKR